MNGMCIMPVSVGVFVFIYIYIYIFLLSVSEFVYASFVHSVGCTCVCMLGVCDKH